MSRPQSDLCDLCGSSDSYRAAEASPDWNRTVICKSCGLIYTSPPLSVTGLEQIYTSFEVIREGLGGPSGDVRDRLLREEERLARDWAMPILSQATDLRHKAVLDLRCRTGALSALLEQEGAEVHGVEPFDGNVRYAKEVRGLSHVYPLPFVRFHELDIPIQRKFDVAVSLSDHVLAHVASPRRLLTRLFELLEPGGYLIFDEKDILQPTTWNLTSILASGKAHLYHLTVDTTMRYVRSAGFEIERCHVDSDRITNFRHMCLVARKPEHAPASYSFALAPGAGPTPRAVRRRVRMLNRSLRNVRARRRVEEAARSALGHVPGARGAWRLLRRVAGGSA